MSTESLPCNHLIADSLFRLCDGTHRVLTHSAVCDELGRPIAPPAAWCAQGHGWLTLTPQQYEELKAVVM